MTKLKLLFTALVFVTSFMMTAAGAQEWKQLPGAAKDVGEGWVIGTNGNGPGGFGIYRWNGSSWDNMPGAAVRVGGTFHKPWVVNARDKIYRWNGSGWDQLPGAAKDVGQGWVIGTNSNGPGGFGIYRWNGSSWDQMPGAAVRIGGTYLEPWVVNAQDIIYRWNGSGWDQLPGAAKDVGEGWVIGTNDNGPGGFGIYRWNGSSWDNVAGAAVQIGGTALDVWVVNAQDIIYRTKH